MATFYSTGTVDVTNGSTTVDATGTAFVSNVADGWCVVLPDGRTYGITNVINATRLSITPAYDGATETGGAYLAFPTTAGLLELAVAFEAIRSDFQDSIDNQLNGVFEAGSIGAPGLRFDVDNDSGLRRVSANKLALTVGGIDALVIEDGAPSGTMVQSDVQDETAERLLKTGAFGLGATDLVDVLRDNGRAVLPSGFYAGSGSAANANSFPAPNAPYWPFLNLNRRTGGSAWRSWRLFFDGQAAYMRKSTDSGASWDDPITLYGSENLLGTVSQSAGLPTGAVIERGSNANGDYVRFADGTQICQARITLDYVNVSKLSASWTYPAAFETNEKLILSGMINAGEVSAGVTGPDVQELCTPFFGSVTKLATLAQISRIPGQTNFNSGDELVMPVCAIGTWF